MRGGEASKLGSGWASGGQPSPFVLGAAGVASQRDDGRVIPGAATRARLRAVDVVVRCVLGKAGRRFGACVRGRARARHADGGALDGVRPESQQDAVTRDAPDADAGIGTAVLERQGGERLDGHVARAPIGGAADARASDECDTSILGSAVEDDGGAAVTIGPGVILEDLGKRDTRVRVEVSGEVLHPGGRVDLGIPKERGAVKELGQALGRNPAGRETIAAVVDRHAAHLAHPRLTVGAGGVSARDRPLDDARRLGYDRRSRAPRGRLGHERGDALARLAQQRADAVEGEARGLTLARDLGEVDGRPFGAACLLGGADDPGAGAQRRTREGADRLHAPPLALTAVVAVDVAAGAGTRCRVAGEGQVVTVPLVGVVLLAPRLVSAVGAGRGALELGELGACAHVASLHAGKEGVSIRADAAQVAARALRHADQTLQLGAVVGDELNRPVPHHRPRVARLHELRRSAPRPAEPDGHRDHRGGQKHSRFFHDTILLRSHDAPLVYPTPLGGGRYNSAHIKNPVKVKKG